jgi:hypothetical protein
MSYRSANEQMKSNRRLPVALAPREKFGRAVHAPALLWAAVAYLFR